ncbi:MAG TPA: hypothetical protein VMT20_29395 [Terriglobia bacterium]|nr:hypothetical protein [Terriglobia bacterium]
MTTHNITRYSERVQGMMALEHDRLRVLNVESEDCGGAKLVVAGNHSKDEQRLIEAWVDRHKA